MTKTYCDRCEKEIEKDDGKMTCDIRAGWNIKKYYVLCEKCGFEIIKQLDKKIKE